MVGDDLSTWLAQRQPPPPEPIAGALAHALAVSEPAPGAASASAAFRLAAAGTLALRRAVALGDARPAAFELLTADALLTYAIERAAEEGMAELDALLASLTPAALYAAVPGGS
jgi:hypothetical protein